jgi:hypothetical protein
MQDICVTKHAPFAPVAGASTGSLLATTARSRIKRQRGFNDSLLLYLVIIERFDAPQTLIKPSLLNRPENTADQKKASFLHLA